MTLFKTSLFALGIILSSSAFAATGTGHAQAELSNPLTVTAENSVNFGTVAIDASAGAQTVTMTAYGGIDCPAAYSCSPGGQPGSFNVSGNPNTQIHISLEGSTATLSDGAGNTITFDPEMYAGETFSQNLNASGQTSYVSFREVLGTLYFTGNEPAGTYSTSNAGGSGFPITVNY